jgi:recombination protein RecR
MTKKKVRAGEAMAESEIERLTQLLARVPGLGPRSARRALLQLLKRRETLLVPLAQALLRAAEEIRNCSVCGNLDTLDPCRLCRDSGRDEALLCVVAEVADLWALERAQVFAGRYHVLAGLLSALDGRGPREIGLERLIERAREPGRREIVLALPVTLEGQTTAHTIAERLAGSGLIVTRLAQGVPVGGELDYLDDGTLATAMKSRRPVL